ncbi:MAG: hypothetical protein QOE19_4092 [Actinomycetota bacterium]|nr:hypothetical protein [Actinomycetota bacterium]
MTPLGRRLSDVRRSDDSGSALALALVFLMIFGVYIGVVLQFATTGHRTTTAVREEAVNTYAGGGAIDGAVNAVRAATGTGVDPGTATPPAASPCFTLPAGQLGNPSDIAVTCQPRQGSGGDPPAALQSQPAQAILARSTNAAEGVSLTAGPFSAQGRVQVKQGLRLTGSATLSSTGANAAVQAGNCTGATTSPACVTTTSIPGDPGWAAPTEYPAVQRVLPACTAQNRVVTLSPGTYLDGGDLQVALTCATNTGRVIWFKPGTYYFDFRDTTRELQILSAAVVVGGTPLGWTPNTTLPANVPVPSAANPTRSACDLSAQGVQLVFAGDSRMRVLSGGDIQLCAENTSGTAQHVVLRGLAAQTASLPAAQPTTGAATAATTTGTGANWSNPADGPDVDGNVAIATATRNTTTRALRVGPFPAGLVPPEATNIAVTVSLTGGMVGPGATNVRLTNGTTLLTSTPLRTCPAAGCNDTALRTDSVTIAEAGLTAAIANSMYVDVLVSSRDVGTPNGGQTTGAVDGITVSVDFSAPMRPTSGTGVGAPYLPTTQNTTTTPILRTAGPASTTVVALHGTVDAQLAAVDLATTLVPYTVIDRGIAVRHLQSSMTRAAGYTGPLISVPDLPQGPRRVLLLAKDTSSAVLARADVVFANTAGTANGTVPTVTEWSVN